MHDPMTQAFQIPNPLAPRYSFGTRWSDRDPLVTIWHRDPERGGDDDSCGWCFVTLTREDTDWAQATARQNWELDLGPKYGRINLRGADDLAVLAWAWGEARSRAGGPARRAPLTAWELGQVVALLTCPGDNFHHLVADARRDEEGLAHLLALTLRVYRTRRRPWWRHPRWHLHHWRFQVRPLLHFKRWAFSRCQLCGGRFRWGEAVVGTWDGGGPRWFRNGERVWHAGCDTSRKPDPARQPAKEGKR